MNHREISLLAGLALLLAGCGSSSKSGSVLDNRGTDNGDAGTGIPVTKIDRSGLMDVGTNGPLDYGDPRMWLCRPGNDPDECDASLDATELLPDSSQKVEPHVKAADPKFDCFYVYPTVKLSAAGPMTDFSNVDI